METGSEPVPVSGETVSEPVPVSKENMFVDTKRKFFGIDVGPDFFVKHNGWGS